MDHGAHGQSNGMSWRAPLVFLGFAAIAAFFLLSEHRAHLLGILPWALLLLACPLLHRFMHGGHGGHGGEGSSDQATSRAGSKPTDIPPAETGAHRH
ncbi:DUF2933 domain-containing protein [Sphingopyxis chilensis]